MDRHWVREAERRIVSTPYRLRVHSGNRENFRVLARWWLGLERKRERERAGDEKNSTFWMKRESGSEILGGKEVKIFRVWRGWILGRK